MGSHAPSQPNGVRVYTPTFERRWLISNSTDGTLLARLWTLPVQRIRQTYFIAPDGRMARVRIVANKVATLTVKTGFGIAREEEKYKMQNAAAEQLLSLAAPVIIEKARYFADNGRLVIDAFTGEPLAGLMIAEVKMTAKDEPAELPAWLEGIEVTNSLTNEHIFELLKEMTESPSVSNPRELLLQQLPIVVITGGPGSGKSTVIDALVNRHGDVVHCVREVATVVISHMRVPPPRGDALKIATFQRTIFDVQRRFERVSRDHALLTGKKLVVTDRATMDGACYLPGGIPDFERLCRTQRDAEYARYTKVICLGTPPPEIYAAIVGNNPARSETHAQAAALGAAIVRAWEAHPNFKLIPTTSIWEEKLHLVLTELAPYLCT